MLKSLDFLLECSYIEEDEVPLTIIETASTMLGLVLMTYTAVECVMYILDYIFFDGNYGAFLRYAIRGFIEFYHFVYS